MTGIVFKKGETFEIRGHKVDVLSDVIHGSSIHRQDFLIDGAIPVGVDVPRWLLLEGRRRIEALKNVNATDDQKIDTAAIIFDAKGGRKC